MSAVALSKTGRPVPAGVRAADRTCGSDRMDDEGCCEVPVSVESIALVVPKDMIE